LGGAIAVVVEGSDLKSGLLTLAQAPIYF
jgi:hypothetical protein